MVIYVLGVSILEAISDLASVDIHIAFTLFQVEIALVAGMAMKSSGSIRDRHTTTFTFLYMVYVVFSDLFFSELNPIFIELDSLIFIVGVLWVYFRPYTYKSDILDWRGERIYLGFYHGNKAPILSFLFSMVGLPFYSFCIIAGDKVLRASRSGKMVVSNANALNPNDYIFINTNKTATSSFFVEMGKIVGKSTKEFGVLKSKCLLNCAPLLDIIGIPIESLFDRMPSIFLL